MAGKSYTAEFKRGALALADREGMSEAAAILGVNENMLYRWRREAHRQGEHTFAGRNGMTDEETEIASLKEDKEILKKALAIFPHRK